MAYHGAKDYDYPLYKYTPLEGTEFIQKSVMPTFTSNKKIDFPDDKTKLHRRDTSLPYSILKLPQHAVHGPQFFIVSRYQVDIPGGFGRIKIAYRLIKTTDVNNLMINGVRYTFDKTPLALKISRQHDFGHPNNVAALYDIYNYGHRITESEQVFTSGEMWAEGQTHIKHYQIMPYFPGQNLSDLIKSVEGDRLLGLEDIRHLKELLQTKLKVIHDTNLVHRDIKPENILVDFDASGTVKDAHIIDFDFMVENGTIVRPAGTIEYLSSKLQAIVRKRSDQRVYPANKEDDIYAMNIIFTELDELHQPQADSLESCAKRVKLQSTTTSPAVSPVAGVPSHASAGHATASFSGPTSAPTSPTKVNPSSLRNSSFADGVRNLPVEAGAFSAALEAQLNALSEGSGMNKREL